MKNLLLLAFWLFFMPVMLHAQLQKNNLLLEGSFAYSRSTPRYTPGLVAHPPGHYGQVPMDIVSQSMFLSPTVGLFLTDRLVVSTGIIFNRSSRKEESIPFNPNPGSGYGAGNLQSSSLAISNDIAPVLALRYFQPLINKFYLSARLGAAYHFSKSKQESKYSQESYGGGTSGAYATKYSSNRLALNFSPQLVYFVNHWLGLEAQLGDLTLITAQKDSRFPEDRQPGSSLDLSLASSAWKFGILVNLRADKN